MQAELFYTQSIKELNLEKKSLERVLLVFGWVRLLVFVIFLLAAYFTFGYLIAFVIQLVVSIIVFLFVVSKYTDCKTELEIVNNKLKLFQAEINALSGDFSGFNAGEKYASNSHPFSGDLDLFKSNGLFSFINRTTSDLGEQTLASMLLNGNEQPEEVSDIIEKIAGHTTWTFHFRALGLKNTSEKQTNIMLHSVLASIFPVKPWLYVARIIIPSLAFVSLILFKIDVISTSIFSLLMVMSLIPTSLEVKNTNAVANQIYAIENRLVILHNQFNSLNKLYELDSNKKWMSLFLEEQPKEIAKKLNQLIKIIGKFQARNNMVLGIPLNVFFAWDINQRIKLTEWITNNQLQWNNWELGIAKMEAYISAATIRFNYPNTLFAQKNQKDKKEMKGLIHPLLAHTTCVANDFQLEDNKQFLILTGPNMAGKSTYLRAIGSAILFANAGFPIFATHYNYPQVQLYTSMRTSDNLSENSSYFFAELTRLRNLMDVVEQKNGTVFVLLDEILKGTNSKDKEEGSYKFMEKMQSMGAEGVIATHDLSLCTLEKNNNAFLTGHFDSVIKNEELTFDYLIKPGVCQNMNASFLLKKMNLVN